VVHGLRVQVRVKSLGQIVLSRLVCRYFFTHSDFGDFSPVGTEGFFPPRSRSSSPPAASSSSSRSGSSRELRNVGSAPGAPGSDSSAGGGAPASSS
jgi:hypothetical protein